MSRRKPDTEPVVDEIAAEEMHSEGAPVVTGVSDVAVEDTPTVETVVVAPVIHESVQQSAEVSESPAKAAPAPAPQPEAKKVQIGDRLYAHDGCPGRVIAIDGNIATVLLDHYHTNAYVRIA